MNESQTDRVARVLLRAGRSGPPLELAKAEAAFGTRLMAALRERKAAEESPWLLWNRVVWRLVPALAAAVLVLAGFSFLGTNGDDALASWRDPLGLDLALVDGFGGGDR